jgi:hypothetical protein
LALLIAVVPFCRRDAGDDERVYDGAAALFSSRSSLYLCPR